MEGKKKPIQGIQELDKNPLFCNQMTISHSATEFIIDFRLVYPQFAPDNSQTTMVRHSTVIFEPWHLKEVLGVIQENIERYEKEYGKIKESEALKKAKKKVKQPRKIASVSTPDYLG